MGVRGDILDGFRRIVSVLLKSFAPPLQDLIDDVNEDKPDDYWNSKSPGKSEIFSGVCQRHKDQTEDYSQYLDKYCAK